MKSDRNTIETEVLVVGASASGTCAAVQAARLGRSVILCEPTGWVGGMLTAAGVSAIDGNHHLPSGMWGEFRAALYRHYRTDSLATGWVSNTLFEPRVGERVLRAWIDEQSSLELLLSHRLVSVIRSEQRVYGACFKAPGVPDDHIEIRAEVTVFADEFGDAVEMAGLRWHTGLESRTETGESQAPEHAYPVPQDCTWAATIQIPPSGFAAQIDTRRLDADDEFTKLLGEPAISWDRFFDYGRLPNGYAMLNFPGHDYPGNYLDTRTRRGVLSGAQARTQRLVELLRATFGPDSIRLPDIYPGHLAAIPYIREARRIFAIASLTINNLLTPWESGTTAMSVAVGDYPVDHHRSKDGNAPGVHFPAVHAFTVPYSVMVPDDLDGVLVAEKSIGVTGLVNGCTRLQPVVMQLGQAAGAAASLCVTQMIAPRSVEVRALQELLLKEGVMLVPARDVPPDHASFAPLHRAAVTGALRLRYESEGWANKAFLDGGAPAEGAPGARSRESREHYARRLYG